MHTVRLVISLVSQLAAYTEEGVALAPSVFICNSVSRLIHMGGAGEYVPLGTGAETEGAAGKILKAAAPLCSGIWRIYVERSADGATCNFGVFCGSSDPSSFTVDETLLQGVDENFPIIRIAQSVVNKVEVRTSSGSGIEFRFNSDADISQLDNQSKVSKLSSAACSDIIPDDESFARFVERVLSAAIRDSHGTLLVVVPASRGSVPDQLSDVLPISPPVDLYERYQLHLSENKTAISVSRLQAAAELLAGLINSDGITVLDTRGRILGYRAFVKSDEPAKPSEGGARTRAYAALTALVGPVLKAAFFRSQDGRMDLKVSAGSSTNA
ncbi:hypothetical protein FPV16_05630 [Methylobacterium sp. W2]|uniref:hypothetical protein n=1 Tax=Methylobacterium sp. W2 TaxID=2598107 RepID=UPI001D0BF91F|nr:hypothetical protein [Methylobacterium sp. W2]MCC0805709.1 hypothetical protein [Methylobacterium sp. W2]